MEDWAVIRDSAQKPEPPQLLSESALHEVIGKLPARVSLDFEEKFKEARTNPERRRVLDRFLEEEYDIAKDAPWWIEANRLIPRMERDPTERTTQVDVKPEREPQRGFEGLPQKGTDLSKYIDGARLTDRQRDCFSLKYFKAPRNNKKNAKKQNENCPSVNVT